jgi:hypothetical protein
VRTAAYPLTPSRHSHTPLKNAPEETRIIAKPEASNRMVVINLEEGTGIKTRDLEGTTLNITVDKIHDLHGNTSDPIKWSTYVQLNTLKWLKDSVNIIKMYGDEYIFDVDIENRGGRTENYTFYNMPQWLTLVDSEYADVLNPLSTKRLRFRVDPLVAVSNYDVTIGLQGNNEILEPLRIVMKVKGQAPDWTVNPEDYENSMSIVGIVYINGILMENSESRVAAFINGQCRGVAMPKKVRGAAYVAMNIYGSSIGDKDSPITFCIWDASTGMSYININSAVDGVIKEILFSGDGLLGSFDSPVVWTKSDQIEQTIPLRRNWNWMSLGIDPAEKTLWDVFEPVSKWASVLKTKNNAISYCNGTEWKGSLATVEGNKMYKLKLTNERNSEDVPARLTVIGRQLGKTEAVVTLEKGWNWIAYTPLKTIGIDEALAAANPQQGDRVKSQTAFAIYGPNKTWEGTLTAMEPGHGYMYYSTEDVAKKQFVYPTVSSSASSRRSLHSPLTSHLSSLTTHLFTPVPGTDYSENMSMVIKLMNGDEVVDTAEVASFIDGECRGATRALTDGLYYLLIAGEGSGQTVEICTCINGEIVTLDNSLTYSSDSNVGTPWEPYVIQMSSLATHLLPLTTHNSGQSPNCWYTLQGLRMGTNRPTVPGVYICNGEKVIIKTIKK